VDQEYRKRSPIFFLDAAKGVPTDINCGIQDGHTGSVPISHSLRAFNVIANANSHPSKTIAEEDIQIMVSTQGIPRSLGDPPNDDTYSKRVLFRREAGAARVTVFEGGHENLNEAAFAWLAKQRKR
jgi:hypothetical protein